MFNTNNISSFVLVYVCKIRLTPLSNIEFIASNGKYNQTTHTHTKKKTSVAHYSYSRIHTIVSISVSNIVITLFFNHPIAIGLTCLITSICYKKKIHFFMVLFFSLRNILNSGINYIKFVFKEKHIFLK